MKLDLPGRPVDDDLVTGNARVVVQLVVDVARGVEVPGVDVGTENTDDDVISFAKFLQIARVVLFVKTYDALSADLKEGRKEMFYLTVHSTHFIYGYMVKDHSDSEK